MSYSIDLNDLTRRPGSLSGTKAVRQSPSQGYRFLSLAAQLQASESRLIRTSKAAMAEEDKASFWEQRMETHKKFMELQQKEAARRRILMKLRMNGGSVSAAELLMGLL